jgi:hypothetical protein
LLKLILTSGPIAFDDEEIRHEDFKLGQEAGKFPQFESTLETRASPTPFWVGYAVARGVRVHWAEDKVRDCFKDKRKRLACAVAS